MTEQERGPSGLWDGFIQESMKPGPTMTITKAQYAAILERIRDTGLDVERLTNAIHWSGMVLVDAVSGKPVEDAEQTVARYYIEAAHGGRKGDRAP